MSYPEYFDELRGIADGSGQSLLDVLLLNLDEELSYFATNNSMPHAAPPVRRRKGVRSHTMLVRACGEGVALIGCFDSLD